MEENGFLNYIYNVKSPKLQIIIKIYNILGGKFVQKVVNMSKTKYSIKRIDSAISFTMWKLIKNEIIIIYDISCGQLVQKFVNI